MKKLMIALAAAAAITGVAKADIDNHVTTFESENLKVGAAFDATLDDEGTQTGAKYWAIEEGATEPYAIVTNADFNGSAPTNTSTKALTIDTDKLLSRKVKAGDAGAESFETAPLYFDGYVQFTAADSVPDLTDGDKLVVWLYGADEETAPYGIGTNLVITAATVNEEGVPSPTNFFMTTEMDIQPNSWHRLSIKAYKSGDFPVFAVYVDGTKISAATPGLDNGRSEFNSLVAFDAETAPFTLSSVSFKGTGAVDDLGFTNVDLFPEAAAETFTLTATAAHGTLSLYKDYDCKDPISGSSPWTMEVPGAKVYAKFTLDSGYTYVGAKLGETDLNADEDSGDYYLELDLTGAVAGDTLALVITVSGGGSSDYPSYIDGIEDATTKAAYQNKYNAWKETYGADAESSYQSQFLLNIAPNQKAELTTAAIVVENGVVKITTSPAAGNVNGKVYIKKAETVQGLANTAWTEAAVSASGDDVGKVTDTAGDAGFYQIKVDF